MVWFWCSSIYSASRRNRWFEGTKVTLSTKAVDHHWYQSWILILQVTTSIRWTMKRYASVSQDNSAGFISICCIRCTTKKPAVWYHELRIPINIISLGLKKKQPRRQKLQWYLYLWLETTTQYVSCHEKNNVDMSNFGKNVVQITSWSGERCLNSVVAGRMLIWISLGSKYDYILLKML